MKSILNPLHALGAPAPRNALRLSLRGLGHAPLGSLMTVAICLLGSAISGPSAASSGPSTLIQAASPSGSSRPAAANAVKVISSSQRNETRGYDGLWRVDAPRSEAGRFESLAALVAFGATLPSDYQLTDVEIEVDGGEEELLGLWSQVGEAAHQLHIDLADLNTKRNELAGVQQLIDLEVYRVDGQLRYAGIWRPSAADERVEVDLDWAQLVAFKASHGTDGYQLVDVEPYATPAGWRYAGLWHPGAPTVHLEHETNGQTFVETAMALAQEDGWRLIDVERRVDGNAALFVGLWEQGSDADWLSMRVLWSRIEGNDSSLSQGLLPQEEGAIPSEGPVLVMPSVVRRLVDIERVGDSKAETARRVLRRPTRKTAAQPVVTVLVQGGNPQPAAAGPQIVANPDEPISQNAIHDEPTTGPPDG